MEPTAQSSQPDLEKLYHYSTPAGFNGILKSKSLWMTNIRYQNDIEEYDYAFNLVGKILAEEYPSITHHGVYLDPAIASIYTFSLTQQSDLLSQWRGYCRNGGYSFSFDKSLLETTLQSNGLELVKCIYDVEEQKQFVRSTIMGIDPKEFEELAKKSQEVLHNKNTNDGYAFYARNRGFRALGLALKYYAARFKHPKFAEEEEWRLIKDISLPTEKRFIPEFRDAKDTIIPYIKIPLVEEEHELKLSSITVGPSPRQHLALQACRLIPGINPIASDIPFRSWE